MGPIFQRAFKAAFFDRRTFDDVQWDRSATADAVILVALVSAILFLVSELSRGFRATSFVTGLLNTVIVDIAGWLLLAAATWFAGSRIFKPAGNNRRGMEFMQPMMRVHGVAYLPVILGLIPGIVGVLGTLWYLAAASVGTAQVLDTKTYEGGIAVLLGAAVLFIFRTLFRFPFAVMSGLS